MTTAAASIMLPSELWTKIVQYITDPVDLYLLEVYFPNTMGEYTGEQWAKINKMWVRESPRLAKNSSVEKLVPIDYRKYYHYFSLDGSKQLITFGSLIDILARMRESGISVEVA